MVRLRGRVQCPPWWFARTALPARMTAGEVVDCLEEGCGCRACDSGPGQHQMTARAARHRSQAERISMSRENASGGRASGENQPTSLMSSLATALPVADRAG